MDITSCITNGTHKYVVTDLFTRKHGKVSRNAVAVEPDLFVVY